eukprot:1257675-Pyramimonas_sp.AAC.1
MSRYLRRVFGRHVSELRRTSQAESDLRSICMGGCRGAVPRAGPRASTQGGLRGRTPSLASCAVSCARTESMASSLKKGLLSVSSPTHEPDVKLGQSWTRTCGARKCLGGELNIFGDRAAYSGPTDNSQLQHFFGARR